MVRLRAAANGLAGPPCATPAEVAGRLLAVQSQDVQPSAWSIAQRLDGATEQVVERSRASGELVRTHVLRPTWHDVRAEDLRWLLALTGPRVLALMTSVRRELALDDDVLRTARRVVEEVLPGRHLTRPQITAALAAAGLALDARAAGHALMALELQGVVCSGARAGRAQTYALLDERVAPAAPLGHEEAVALLVRRFLTGHGPATVADLAWWSGLLVRDLRASLSDLGPAVRRDEVVGLELWSAVDAPPAADPPAVALVQLYDEHLVAFTQSKHLTDPGRVTSTRVRPYLGVVLTAGTVAGSWGRTLGSRGVTVRVELLHPVDADGLATAAAAYGAFVGLPVTLVRD